jgi:hypothetical protein
VDELTGAKNLAKILGNRHLQMANFVRGKKLKAFGLGLEDTKSLKNQISLRLTSSTDLAERELGGILGGDAVAIMIQKEHYQPPLAETLSLLGMAAYERDALVERYRFSQLHQNIHFSDKFPTRFAHFVYEKYYPNDTNGYWNYTFYRNGKPIDDWEDNATPFQKAMNPSNRLYPEFELDATVSTSAVPCAVPPRRR